MLTQKQITREISQLTGQALNKYIKEVIVKPIFLSFSAIMQLPQYSKLQEKEQIDFVLKIFTKQTYQTYKARSNKQLNLNDRQIQKLRQLSILTLFEGINQFSLSRLAAYLEIDTVICVQMLLAMNISRLIKVKIDEQKNIIDIYFANRRELITTTNQENTKTIVTIEGRISKIINANHSLQNQIKAALQVQNTNKTKVSQKQRRTDLEKRMKFF